MFRIVKVKVLDAYRVELTYADGVHGVADLSHLVGKGVFSLWDDYDAFRSVQIGEGGELHWSDEVGLCPDALYMRITGKAPEEAFPRLRRTAVHA